MPHSNNPSEIARKTLIELATRKLPPTPDNYARLYRVIGDLPPGTETLPPPSPDSSSPTPAWPELIRDLLKQLEATHRGITLTHKKEGVNKVMVRFSKDPARLYEKLQGLIRSWSAASPVSRDEPVIPDIPAAGSEPAAAGVSFSGTAQPAISTSYDETCGPLQEMLAQTLESLSPLLPDLSEEIRPLAHSARAARDREQIASLGRTLRQFLIKLELRGNDKTRIQAGLVRLLHLLLENVGELVSDDQWLHGQITVLQEVIARPMDRQTIADAERNLRDAVIKQGLLRHSLTDAKSTLKNLMTLFIDRLSTIADSTGEYYDKISGYSTEISNADNLIKLSGLLDNIINDTRLIQSSVLRSSEEMAEARKLAEGAEQRVLQLEQELEQVSELVHADKLTGTLNRRGMDEALAREISRADRSRSRLCIALISIDNFRRINDTLGHEVGDQALTFFTSIISNCVRTTDDLARYGDEEFLIIMPDTGIDDAKTLLVRLQRELTKQIFIHDNRQLLITFSAGVALRHDGEPPEEAIRRADHARYLARQAGNNRVQAAD